MITLILPKLIRGVMTLLIAVTLVFLFIRLAGDPALVLAPPDAPPEVVEQVRQRLGLDQPLPVQYFNYLVGLVHGNFGYSVHTGRPAQDLFFERLPYTAVLGLVALGIAALCGIALGTIAALNHNSPLDRGLMAFSVFAFAMPNFFFGLVLILIGALVFGNFFGGTGGAANFGQVFAPAATLGLASMGTFARFTRSSLLETLNKPFMRAIEARGVPYSRQLLCHAAPNAAIPIITILGLSLGGMVAGAVVTEQVFSWPGIGQLLIRSVQTRDIAVVQFIVIAVAFTMTACNIAVDFLHAFIDPRIRTARNG
ncbi:ABC transporter permease [Agrobacterium sp. CNPSo 2736]|uniref:ABC transporter permease n=1 Tax=Agrobacterium sp. CNPSo 2736 TaxID=2499627 RepID=UPI000FD6BD3C|nr:ABC transporter permease [Agrobacterium sp. CNPSo 2736]RVT69886.1 ABC transporter permease [Agrobacterium sp. CNPSo 2736]